MPNIILFELSGCPFCRKSRATLRAKGLLFTRKIVKTSADYAELARYNPSKQAPVLLYDGEVIADSTDILRFLEKKHPNPPLFPKDPAQSSFCHFLEDWADEALSWYGSAFRWLDPRNDSVAKKQLTIREGNVGLFGTLYPYLGRFVGRLRVIGQGIGRRSVARLEADLEMHLSKIAEAIQDKPFLFGSEVSVADLAVWSQLRSLRFCVQEKLATNHPVIGPYLARVDLAVGDGE